MTRVVSLLPAATEIVAALGAGDALAGVTHECDFPPFARDLPRVTARASDRSEDARVIDADVRGRAEARLPLFALREDQIARLAPDVVVTQALCDVCAVSERDVRELARRLTPEPRIVTLAGATLDGIFADIAAVAEALGLGERARVLLTSLRGRMRRVHETLSAAHAPRPRVAVVEWTDPIYVAGHWVPEMVHRAGGVDVLAKVGEHSVTRTAAELRTADAEVILFSPCGYSVLRAADEARPLLAREEWSWVRGRRAWAVDANGLVSRPGPRVVRGIEVFAAIFNPTLFEPPSAADAAQLETR